MTRRGVLNSAISDTHLPFLNIRKWDVYLGQSLNMPAHAQKHCYKDHRIEIKVIKEIKSESF